MSSFDPSDATSNPASSRVGALLRAVLRYVEARCELVQLEAREATSKSITLVVLVTISLTALFFGWLMLLPGLVWIIAQKGGWHWSEVSLVGAGVHVLIFIIAALILKLQLRKFRVFEDSIGELRKDREWLHTSNPSSHPS